MCAALPFLLTSSVHATATRTTRMGTIPIPSAITSLLVPNPAQPRPYGGPHMPAEM